MLSFCARRYCAICVPSLVPVRVTLRFRVPSTKSPRSLTLIRTPLTTWISEMVRPPFPQHRADVFVRHGDGDGDAPRPASVSLLARPVVKRRSRDPAHRQVDVLSAYVDGRAAWEA